MDAQFHHADMPLLSWDVFIESYQQLLHGSKQVRKDVSAIEKLTRQYQWQQRFNYQPYLVSDKNAIIITDTTQTIIWVSHNFQSMTGFSYTEAVGRPSSFLQGTDTSSETKQLIRRHLDKAEVITQAQLLNYRKNGEAYLCELNIYPLFNKSRQLVHFIAFESEVAA